MVQSDLGLKPADYFTFVPDASPAVSHSKPLRYKDLPDGDLADVLGKQRPYSSDENCTVGPAERKRGTAMAGDC